MLQKNDTIVLDLNDLTAVVRYTGQGCFELEKIEITAWDCEGETVIKGFDVDKQWDRYAAQHDYPCWRQVDFLACCKASENAIEAVDLVTLSGEQARARYDVEGIEA